MKESVMKNILYILLVIVFGSSTIIGPVLAEENTRAKGKVLCKLLESSLTDPWKFDAVFSNENKHFDNSMIAFIQDRATQLTKQAKQRETECEPFKNKFMGHELCAGNNPAKEFATWVDSIMQATKGLRWEKTVYGQGQLKMWSSCNNPALCEQLRLADAVGAKQQCPQWLID